MRSRAAVFLSLGLGLLAAVMMFAYISGRESQLYEQVAMKDVVVAQRDILRGAVMDERLIKVVQVPAKYLQPKAIGDRGEVIGRVVAVPVPAGAQIVGTYLEDAREGALAYVVPRGSRAVTIAASDVTGVGGLVRPGNYVDVLGTFEYGKPTGEQGGRMMYSDERTETRTLMQNVLVIAVGQEYRGEPTLPEPVERAAAAAGREETEQRSRPQTAIRNVTVIVAPHQVQELVLAQQIGTLTLALRSNLDAGKVEDLQTLDPFGLLKVQTPVKTRSEPVWQVIRGTGF